MFAARNDIDARIPSRGEHGAKTYAAFAGRRFAANPPHRARVNSSLRRAEDEVVKNIVVTTSYHPTHSRRDAAEGQADSPGFWQRFLSATVKRLATRLAQEMAFIRSRGWATLAGFFVCACIGVAVGSVSGVVLMDRFSAPSTIIAPTHRVNTPVRPQVAGSANPDQNLVVSSVSKQKQPVAQLKGLNPAVVCLPYNEVVNLRALEAANDALPKRSALRNTSQ
jgi:hypothetical protein